MKTHQLLVRALPLCAMLILASVSVWAVPTGKVHYENEKLTVQAEQTPLFSLLESIKEQTGMQVYLAEGVSPHKVSASFHNRPLRQALMRVLGSNSYALVYSKQGQTWVPSRLEVYPPGQRSGNLKPMSGDAAASATLDQDQTMTVLVDSGHETITHNSGVRKSGILAPTRTEIVNQDLAENLVQQPWFALQQQAESFEARQHRELMLLEQQMNGAMDQKKKEALSTVHAHKMQEFYEQKRAHQNKVESVKRLQEFKELTRRQQAKKSPE
jgi:hypothetical protein